MPTNDPKKRTDMPPKKTEPEKQQGENPETRPAKEPITPKKKGELPPDLAEPVVGEPGAPEHE